MLYKSLRKAISQGYYVLNLVKQHEDIMSIRDCVSSRVWDGDETCLVTQSVRLSVTHRQLSLHRAIIKLINVIPLKEENLSWSSWRDFTQS